ncbi:MAG TPA: DUF3107 domain-containing protein [Acidimicrobiales bacterium]|nr:DUF3107 domain-containing protein [Acidimicrobiales bacterium]
MDVRIGVTYSPKELDLDLGDDVDRAELAKDIEAALGNESGVLWLTDKRGRQVAIPAGKVAYVEIGSPEDERRIGFGAG